MIFTICSIQTPTNYSSIEKIVIKKYKKQIHERLRDKYLTTLQVYTKKEKYIQNPILHKMI